MTHKMGGVVTLKGMFMIRAYYEAAQYLGHLPVYCNESGNTAASSMELLSKSIAGCLINALFYGDIFLLTIVVITNTLTP